jgi:hypothetical protein
MAIDDKTGKNSDTAFSFGVRELRQADLAAEITRELSLDTALPKAANENRGFDPYNTTGSFDRKKNWTRVGKR